MEEEEKKELNDVEEDKRELDEEASVVSNSEERNEIEEDSREEVESVEALKETIVRLTAENQELKSQLDQLHDAFIGSGKDYKEPEEKTYSSVREEYK